MSKTRALGVSRDCPASSLEEWRTAVDPKSGQAYFYNRRTRETRWTPPEGWKDPLETSSGLAASTSSAITKSDSSSQNELHKSGVARLQSAGRGSDRTESEAMQLTKSMVENFDIREAVDPKTGRVYFYDRKTRQVFWTDPRDLLTSPGSQDDGDGGEYESSSDFEVDQDVKGQNKPTYVSEIARLRLDDEQFHESFARNQNTKNAKSGSEHDVDEGIEVEDNIDEKDMKYLNRMVQKPSSNMQYQYHRQLQYQNGDNDEEDAEPDDTYEPDFDDEQLDHRAMQSNGSGKSSNPEDLDESVDHIEARLQDLLRDVHHNGEDDIDEEDDEVNIINKLSHGTRSKHGFGNMNNGEHSHLKIEGQVKQDSRVSISASRASQMSEAPTSARDEAPIEQVRSSLALLKRRMKVKRPSPSPPGRMSAGSYANTARSTPRPSRSAWTSSQTAEPMTSSSRTQMNSPEYNYSPSSDSIDSPMSSFPSGKRTGRQVFTPSAPASATGDQCTRKTGCTCFKCTVGASTADSNDLFPCRNCGRSFGASALEIHQPVCGKVFSTSKKTIAPGSSFKFTPADSRKPISNDKKGTVSSSVKRTSWRNKSQQLRLALQQRAPGTGTMASTLSTTASSSNHESTSDVNPEGLVECPHCQRTFNPKSAERHIPKCSSIRAKPKTLLRGAGRGAYASLKAAKLRQLSPSPDSDGGDAEAFRLHKSNSSRRKSLPASVSLSRRRSVAESGVQLQECPHCYRQFGKKAYDRHLEHCSTLRKRNEKLGIPHLPHQKPRPNSSMKHYSMSRLHEQDHSSHDDHIDSISREEMEAYMRATLGEYADVYDFDAYEDMNAVAAAEAYEGNENLDPMYYGTPYEFIEERDSLRVQLNNM